MLEARFRPLPKWPGKLLNRNGQFKSTYLVTLDRLEYELRRIGAHDVVIEAGFDAKDLRNDGWPRAGTKTQHPGVILYCRSGNEPLRFACGTYKTFEQNMHAIALTLEALRAVDRYGATQAHEQYAGFKALPPAADKDTAGKWTLDEAATWLASRTPWAINASELLGKYDSYRRAYKEAAAQLHPDRGGSQDLFQALQTVAGLFEEHFRIATHA